MFDAGDHGIGLETGGNGLKEQALKEQLEKKVRDLCGDVGTAAAAGMAEALVTQMESEYDRRTGEGEAAIDAYRALLADLGRMEEILRALPKTESEKRAEEERRTRKAWNRKLNAIQGKLNGIWWLLTVIFYFLVSFTFGKWHLTWLIFLSSSIGSIVIDMLFAYNKCVPKKKVFAKLHGILWLAVVIAYFLISFAFGKWHLTWLIFVLGTVIEVIAGLVGKMLD